MRNNVELICEQYQINCDMKLLLRNCHAYVKAPREAAMQFDYYPLAEHEKEYVPPEEQEEDRILDQEAREVRMKEMQSFQLKQGEKITYLEVEGTDGIEDLGYELEWPTAAPFLMLEGYQYMEPINRTQLAKDKLRDYEKSLNLSVEETFEPRLNDENHIRKRHAELFMNRMAPLTPTFLKQGVNFLTAHVFAKIMESGKMVILKDLLSGGAFESVTFVRGLFLDSYLPYILGNPRNEFLLNILCFEHSLTHADDELVKEIHEVEMDMDASSLADQSLYGEVLIKVIKNHKELNRLRLFWAFQRRFLPQEDHFDYIIEELNHVSFRVAPALQADVTREVRFVLNSAYSSASFENLLMELVLKFKTFHEFITAYALSVLALSKLRSIKRLLPESKSNELHPIFQMIQFNLSKELHHELILMIITMLTHEDHSRIEYENLKRSYNYWLKDYTQPLKTQYHSPLTRLLEANEKPIEVFYERSSSQPAYAKFALKLNRGKETPHPRKYFGQADMVKHILKKDYQPVLDHFVTTFNFTAHKDHSKKLTDQMRDADRNLSFQNNNEAALYKLKAAHNIFFSQSLPEPLSPRIMQSQKFTYNSLIVIDEDLIDQDEHVQQYRAFNKFQGLLDFINTTQGEKITGQKPAQAEAEAEAGAEVDGEAVEAVEAVEGAGQAVAEVVEAAGEGQLSPEDAQALAAAESAANDDAQEEAVYKSNQMLDAEEEQQKQFDVRQAIINGLLQETDDEPAETSTEDSDLPEEIRQMLKERKNNMLNDENIYELYIPEGNLLHQTDEDAVLQSWDTEYEATEDIEFLRLCREQVQLQNDPNRGFFSKKNKEAQEGKEESSETSEEGESSESSDLPEQQQKPRQAQRQSGFAKKNYFEFCTVSQVPEQTTPAAVPVFQLERMEEYRRKEVDQGFLSILQSEQHISTVSSGNSVAKYLFLHGKNEAGFVLRPGRTLSIEFTSVIGTRAKNYDRFIRGNLFRYALPEELYEDLLLGQAKRYNRHEFKTIVAHMMYYCDSLNEHVIKALCSVCERERIGYTFVEIAQLIKVNDIRLTSDGLQILTELWQRFDIINEDLLPFLREYTRKMQMPLRTDFYASFCRSLIRTKNYEKLQVIAVAILQEIRPRPFKLDASTGNLKGEQVAVLEKEWKAREHENYLRLYIELIEVIVRSLENTVPAYLADLFDEYRRLKPAFNEKELGYAFVCNALKRDKVEELLLRLDNEPEKGTSFMYDCLLQTLLSNFDALEDLSEKMLDASILKNRVVLTNPQIMRSLTVFKKSSSSNSFSKFLDHCLRFQEDINQSHEIKREMFYILNNNVEDVSVGGIFNLLDFIFNEKRQKERVEYRAVKLSEEEKARKLVEIQQAVTKAAPKPKEVEKVPSKKEGKKKGKPEKVETPAAEQKIEEKEKEAKGDEKQKEGEKAEEGMSKKQEKKKLKKEKANERERQNSLLDQVMAEQEAKSMPQTAEMRGSTDDEFVGAIKSQTRKNESAKRKSLQSMSTLFEGSMELSKEEEVPKGKGKDEKKGDPKDAKDDKKKKGKK